MTKNKINVGQLYTCSEGFKWPIDDPQNWQDISNRLRWRRRHMPSMKTWLSAAAYRDPVARFLLRYGQCPKPAPVQSLCEEAVGHCYMYSYGMMSHYMDEKGKSPFKYMVGIAMTASQQPQHHAWNMVAGEVLDATWSNPYAVKYCGIEVGQDLFSFLDVVHDRVNLALFLEFEKMWPYLENYCHAKQRRRAKTTVGA